ncbi:DUF5677 domain-containing protein [Embleya sp. NPDC020630]|uniref:DUF5677 domain-containing protein n=1 Tax=Embleya sp. NPDC020630 TaxID=3363979 RepID=UPI0037B6E55E
MTDDVDFVANFHNDERTPARSRRAVTILIEAADTLLRSGDELGWAPGRHTTVFPLYGWWRLVHRSAQALFLLTDNGYTVESAALTRGIIEHAYAMAWLVDNGDAATHAVVDHGNKKFGKQVATFVETSWPGADELARKFAENLASTTREPSDRALYDKCLHEAGNFRDLMERHGMLNVYPVYQLLSSLSHPGSATASAYLRRGDDDGIQVRATAGTSDLEVVVQVALAVVVANEAISPRLRGDPMRPALDSAKTELGLEGVDFRPRRL